MKKILFAIVLVVLVSMLALTGCEVLVRADGDSMSGSGNLETRQYDFSDFTRIDIGDAFNYDVIQSDAYSVSITADDNLFEDVRVTQSGEELKIDLKPFIHFGIIRLEAEITLPRLTGLDSSGATDGTVKGFHSGDNLDLEVSGASRVKMSDMNLGNIDGSVSGASTLEMDIIAGDVDLEISGASRVEGNLEAKNMIVDLSGASRIELDGSGDNMEVEASGASSIKMGDFTVINADISLSGASNGKIHVTGKIDASLSGASALDFTGNPSIGKIGTTGGSKINGQSE